MQTEQGERRSPGLCQSETRARTENLALRLATLLRDHHLELESSWKIKVNHGAAMW